MALDLASEVAEHLPGVVVAPHVVEVGPHIDHVGVAAALATHGEGLQAPHRADLAEILRPEDLLARRWTTAEPCPDDDDPQEHLSSRWRPQRKDLERRASPASHCCFGRRRPIRTVDQTLAATRKPASGIVKPELAREATVESHQYPTEPLRQSNV